MRGVPKVIQPLFCAGSAALALCACGDAGLRKDAEGRVTYAHAQSETVNASLTGGRFVREDGCIKFELVDGRRFLPILPEGQLYSVEPMDALFDGDWVVTGFDTSTLAVQALRDDPVALACRAAPAFIQNIGRPPPPPPPPPV